MREGWEYKDIGEIANVTDYVANGSFATLRENVHYLDTAGYAILVRLADYTNNFDSSRFVYIDEHAYHFLSKSKLYGGEIIMSNVGSIGKSFICPKLSMPMSLAPNSILINTSNNKFYYYFFGSPFFQRSLKTISSQTALPKFNKTQFKKLIAPIPPLAEQEKIVGELDLLSGVIEKKKAQLEEYDQLAQSIFYDMFGDPITNEKGWEVKKLGDIGKIITGNTPSTRDERNYDSEDVCFFKPSDIARDGISLLGESEFHVSTFAYNNARQLPKGSILVTCIGIVGKVGILEINAMCNQQINAIIPNEDIASVYIAYGVLSERKIIESIAHAPVVPIINKGEFSQLRIPIPPLSLQQEFADKIESIERQKELIKQSIAETETLFNSRMDYYFN